MEEKQKVMAEAKAAEEASQRMNISRKMIFICVLPGTVCVHVQHKHPHTPTLCAQYSRKLIDRATNPTQFLIVP